MSCHGCKHLSYNGPQEFKNRTKLTGESAIPLYPEEKLSPGTYRCSKFGERISPANKTPVPLVAEGACKETR